MMVTTSYDTVKRYSNKSRNSSGMSFWKTIFFIVLLAFINLLSISIAKAWGNEYPKINQFCPNFELKNGAYFKDKKRSLKDFQGEFVILDFWNAGCGVCLASFPKTDALQSKFRGKVRIVLVGRLDKEKSVVKLFERSKLQNSLNLSIAYDSTLYRRFVHFGAPHLIWIDKNGIVKAITTSEDLTEQNISHFINEEKFSFIDRSFDGHANFVKSTILKREMRNGGNETDFVFRSVFSIWKPGMNEGFREINGVSSKTYSKKGIYMLKFPLITLYNVAFFGTASPPISTYRKPVFELADTSIFEYDIDKNTGLYSYTLQVPIDSFYEREMKRIMQNDLTNYFPYRANIEKRMLPCYVLKVVNGDLASAKLKPDSTKKPKWEKYIGGYITSVTVDNLISLLEIGIQNDRRIINETAIEEKISIQINTPLNDVHEVRKQLNAYGLDLEFTKRNLDVLVIKDD
jgi:thiol-disulfide isomerase/thioredoxin